MRWKRTCLRTAAGSEASPAGSSGPRHAAEASPPPAPRRRARGPPAGRRAPARLGRVGSLAGAEPRARLPPWRPAGPSQLPLLPTPGLGAVAPLWPARSLPAASPMRTRRCLRRVSGSLRVSSTFCVDFRTSPCGFLENIPPGPGPAPPPRSRGGQRPPDPPAPGPLHSQRQRQHRPRLLLLPPTPTPMRRGWRGAARSQLPAGPGGGRAGPGRA